MKFIKIGSEKSKIVVFHEIYAFIPEPHILEKITLFVSVQPARESFLTRRHPALIYAACSVILAFGAWMFLHSRTPSPDNSVLARKETTSEPLLSEPESIATDFSWDSPIESELATLNNALTTASAENIFPEAQSTDPTQQDFDAILKELLELEGVKI